MASPNITSLTQHIDELRNLLANYPLDVISINETRLDEGILNLACCRTSLSYMAFTSL